MVAAFLPGFAREIMYQDFYELTGKPFSLLPDPGFLFMSRRHGRTINHLEYGGFTDAGFIVITGDIGAGKTTVIRHYLAHVEDGTTVGLLNNVGASPGNLLGWIAAAFELDRSGKAEIDLHEAFVGFLTAQYAAGRKTVLVVDEAQNLGRDRLEELRVLSNVNYGKDQLLQIILVGQPELLDILKRDDMQQFRQRVAVHCNLDPLDAGETTSYIAHRLSVVGGAIGIFGSDALAAVYHYTGGVPRLINLLCDQALTYGYSETRHVVTGKEVAEVVADRARSGLSPFRNSDDDWSSVVKSAEGKLIRKQVSASLRALKS